MSEPQVRRGHRVLQRSERGCALETIPLSRMSGACARGGAKDTMSSRAGHAPELAEAQMGTATGRRDYLETAEHVTGSRHRSLALAGSTTEQVVRTSTTGVSGLAITRA
jgi:hypothetical protein